MICFSGQMSNLRGSGKGRATRWKVFQRERLSPPLFIIGHKWLVVVVLLPPHFFLYKALLPENFFIWNYVVSERVCLFSSVVYVSFFLFSFFFLSVCSFPWLTEGIIGKQNHFSFIRSSLRPPLLLPLSPFCCSESLLIVRSVLYK